MTKTAAKTKNAQIAARVAPEPKANPNAPKPRKPFAEGTPGWNRQQLGVTLTAIINSINEPNAVVTVMLDEHGQPTGESTTQEVKPSAALKRLRRASFEARGLLGPFAHPNERRKTRRRNGRYAAVGTKGKRPAKKSWHRSKSAAPEAPAKAGKK